MTTAPAPITGAEPTPRRLSHRQTGSDRVFEHGARAVGASVLVITGGIGVFLAWQAVPTLRHYGLSLLHRDASGSPRPDVLGIAAVLVGTVSVALVAMVIAFPLALLTALYITEYAPARLKPTLVSLVDLMAAVPCIVYGLWGVLPAQPHAAASRAGCTQYFGWIPFFARRRRPGRRGLGRSPATSPVGVHRRHRGRDDGPARWRAR